WGPDRYRDARLVLLEAEQLVLHVQAAGRAPLELAGEDRLEVVLGDVDEEREARVAAQDLGPDLADHLAGAALDVRDLVYAERGLQHLVDHAVAVEDLERARQHRARLGVCGERRVGLEEDDGYSVVGQAQRRGEADGTGARDDDRQVGSGPARRSAVR